VLIRDSPDALPAGIVNNVREDVLCVRVCTCDGADIVFFFGSDSDGECAGEGGGETT